MVVRCGLQRADSSGLQALLIAPIQSMCNYYALPKRMVELTPASDSNRGTTLSPPVMLCCAGALVELVVRFRSAVAAAGAIEQHTNENGRSFQAFQ